MIDVITILMCILTMVLIYSLNWPLEVNIIINGILLVSIMNIISIGTGYILVSTIFNALIPPIIFLTIFMVVYSYINRVIKK